jgi:hypothetical protein
MSQKLTQYFVTYDANGVFSLLHLKSIGICFQTEIRKEI